MDNTLQEENIMGFDFEIELQKSIEESDGSLICIVKESVLPQLMKSMDSNGLIAKAIEGQKFCAKNGEILHLINTYSYDNIWMIGASETTNYKKLGATVTRMLIGKNIDKVQLYISDDILEIEDIVSGILLRAYEFDRYKKFSDKEKLHVKKITLCGQQLETETLARLQFEAKSIKWARSLINSSPADIYPQTLAKEIRRYLEPLGIKVSILSGSQLDGMNLLLGVGKASEKEPHVVVMEYNGISNASKDETVALVGKGVTYDCGGLSIKPANYMETMKSDMSGSAIVAAMMANAARNRVQKRVIGIVGLVENMIAGNAMRPDDVIVSLAGHTVEINNTDAEGRLVLADILEYVQKQYDPGTIIDFATLTGAIVVALGHVYAGVFSNDDALSSALQQCGDAKYEPLWRMPMHKDYDAAISSTIADMQNCGKGSAGAGSATAAAFLQRFIHKDRKWAHIDIAGVSFLPYEDFASTVGATGFGVQLINEFLNKLN